MMHVGDIRRISRVSWGYVEYVGVILSTVEILSTIRDIMMHAGGYHEYHRGCSVPWGRNSLLFEYYHDTEHPHGTHDIPHMYHDIPHITQITKDGIPHGTEQPPRYS